MSTLLELRHLTKRFGGVLALDDVSLSFGEGEVVGLIGPNGAGKTTLVNVVTGVFAPNGGTVHFAGRNIAGLRSDRIARLGMARTFQIVQPFPRMTVAENVTAAALFAGNAPSIAAAREEAQRRLVFCGLEREAEKPAASLTLAGRKRIELAKSLALKPRFLFLDEVNAGLNPVEIDHALKLIRAIAETGVTIVLIEHLMKVVMQACSRIVVLHHGKLIADGSPQSVVADQRVVEAYLGKRFRQLQAGGAA